MRVYTGHRCTRPKPPAWGRRCPSRVVEVEYVPPPVEHHADSPACWCEPTVEEFPDGSRLFVHRRAQ